MDKRLLLFLVLSVGIFIGFSALQQWMFPPPPKPAEPDKTEEARKRAEEKEREAAWQKFVSDLFDTPETLLTHYQEARPWHTYMEGVLSVPGRLVGKYEETRSAVANWQRFMADVLGSPAGLLAEFDKARARIDRDIVLGNESDYRLKVVLSEQGAAVRSITLNNYQAANPLNAKPEFLDAARTLKKPLVLVTDDDIEGFAALPQARKLERQSFRLRLWEPKADGSRDKELPIEWSLRKQGGLAVHVDGDAQRVIFEGLIPGKSIKVIKTFTLKPDQQHIDLELSFELTDPAEKPKVIYELTGPRGVPAEGILWHQNPYRHVVFGNMEAGDRGTVVRKLFSPSQINGDKAPPQLYSKEGKESQELQYAGVMVQYFAALAVVNGNPFEHDYIRIAEPTLLDDADVGPENYRGKVSVNLFSRPLEPGKDAPVRHQYLLYAGPVKVSLLRFEQGVNPSLVALYHDKLHLNRLTDSPSDSGFARFFYGIGWTKLLIWFTNKMHWLLEVFHSWTGFYWIAIILLTVLVRTAMFPISRKQTLISRNMQEKMAVLRPELEKIKEKYANDPQGRQVAQMDLYRKHGINPLGGCAGCLIIILQMPIFLGLYYCLQESVHLRLSRFLWVQNLAAPDMLFYWGNWPVISWLANLINLGPYFHILPIVAIALMVVQQKLLMPPPADEQQALQMKMMNYMMIFMAYMFYWIPAGLGLYFIISSGWGMLERKFLPKPATATPSGKPAPAVPERVRGRVPQPDGKASKPGWLKRVGDWWSNLLEQAKKK